MLSQSQIEQFWREGFLVVNDAVSGEQLATLRRELAGWIEESRAHSEPYGPPTMDGRPRFDMGEEHTAEHPALRRVNNPSDISPAYRDVMKGSAMVDMVADLIGPDLKFHHCKINVKLPGSGTVVRYHQDFSYTPHTNDDVVTALLMLDHVDEKNGCLKVVPGSHRGPVLSLFEGEDFTGFISQADEAQARQNAVAVVGAPGSVCFMHTRLLHGSEANTSEAPRPLYICVYTAADAFPIAKNPMPNPNEGKLLRGKATRVARLVDLHVELPQQPKMASFFAVQGQGSAGES